VLIWCCRPPPQPPPPPVPTTAFQTNCNPCNLGPLPAQQEITVNATCLISYSPLDGDPSNQPLSPFTHNYQTCASITTSLDDMDHAIYAPTREWMMPTYIERCLIYRRRSLRIFNPGPDPNTAGYEYSRTVDSTMPVQVQTSATLSATFPPPLTISVRHPVVTCFYKSTWTSAWLAWQYLRILPRSSANTHLPHLPTKMGDIACLQEPGQRVEFRLSVNAPPDNANGQSATSCDSGDFEQST
jgi:hypothetical protein